MIESSKIVFIFYSSLVFIYNHGVATRDGRGQNLLRSNLDPTKPETSSKTIDQIGLGRVNSEDERIDKEMHGDLLSMIESNDIRCDSRNLEEIEKVLLIKKRSLSDSVNALLSRYVKFCAENIIENIEKQKEEKINFFWRPLRWLREIIIDQLVQSNLWSPISQNNMDIDGSHRSKTLAHMLITNARLTNSLATFYLKFGSYQPFSVSDETGSPSVDKIFHNLTMLARDFRSIINPMRHDLVSLQYLERISIETLSELPIELQFSLIDLKVVEKLSEENLNVYDIRRLIQIARSNTEAKVQPFVYYSGLPFNELLAMYHKLLTSESEPRSWIEVWMILKWLLESEEATATQDIGSDNKVELDEARKLEKFSKISTIDCHEEPLKAMIPTLDLYSRFNSIHHYLRHFNTERVSLCIDYLGNDIEHNLESSDLEIRTIGDLVDYLNNNLCSVFQKKMNTEQGLSRTCVLVEPLYRLIDDESFMDALVVYLVDAHHRGLDYNRRFKSLIDSIGSDKDSVNRRLIRGSLETLKVLEELDIDSIRKAGDKVLNSLATARALMILENFKDYDELDRRIKINLGHGTRSKRKLSEHDNIEADSIEDLAKSPRTSYDHSSPRN